MKTKRLIATTCALLLAFAVTAPAWATGPSATDDTGVPRIGFISEVLSWFLDLLPATPQEQHGPRAMPAAASGGGNSGGTTTNDGATVACDICVVVSGRVVIDPDG